MDSNIGFCASTPGTKRDLRQAATSGLEFRQKPAVFLVIVCFWLSAYRSCSIATPGRATGRRMAALLAQSSFEARRHHSQPLSGRACAAAVRPGVVLDDGRAAADDTQGRRVPVSRGRRADRSGPRPVSTTASGPEFRALTIGPSRCPRAALPLEPERQGDIRLSPADAQLPWHRARNADTGRDRRDSAYSKGTVPHPSAIALRVSIERRFACVDKRDTFRRPSHVRCPGRGHGQD